jgi:catechol 2,3-dioxygenase-like lactoylglutathione lyase family enzyme
MPIRASRVQHVGITVRDMERSLAFYRVVLGVEPDLVAEGSGEELSQAVGVSGAELSFAFLRVGDSILELLEYRAPEGRDFELRNCDVGATHVAFEVDDIDAARSRLEEAGVRFSSPPVRIEEGPLAGCAFVYFRDPDGVQLELFEVA